MTNQFEKEAAVRIDILDPSDPNFDQYHGRTGEVIEILTDGAETATRDSRDRTIYRFEFENGEVTNFRWQDLRSK